MNILVLAIGLVFIVEGLVLALAPSRIEEIYRLLCSLPLETRRLMGLLAITTGAIIAWAACWLGGLSI